MQTYLETDTFILSYDANNNVIIARCKSNQTSAEYRENIDAVAVAIKHFKTGKILWDLVHATAIHPDDQAWAATDWYPRALAAGFSHSAHVIAADIFLRLTLDEMQQDSLTLTKNFDNMETAMEWIKQF